MKRLRVEGVIAEVPPFVFVQGKKVAVELGADGCIYPDQDTDVALPQLAGMLTMMLGVAVYELHGTPGQYAGDSDDAESETQRLLEEFDKFEEEVRCAKETIGEPKVEMNVSDPNLEVLQPLGVKIWDSIFVKPAPVLDLNTWMTTVDADGYVYIPNDASKPIQDCEEATSNGMYTEVMVNAYRRLCDKVGINPSVRLVEGTVMEAKSIKPRHGAQHTVLGESSARLANSRLEGFDDSMYAKEFISCICDLEPDEYEKDNVRKKVLAKVEFILMGKTSHTYNQKFVHLLYQRVIHQAAIDDPWIEHLIPLSTALMSICRQMVIEGVVLEESKDLLLSRTDAAGFAEYRSALSEVFDYCGAGGRRG